MSDQHSGSPSGSNDPFAALSGPDRPVNPRAAFTERLRRRLEIELEDIVTTETNPARAPIDQLAPELVNPGSLFYVTMPGPDVERSATFYTSLFGWELHQGNVGYHVANTYPPMGLASNDSTESEVWLEVIDIDEAVAKVRELGGTATEPVHYDSGWTSTCTDPNGARFHITVPRTDYRQPARASSQPGELFYWTLPASDAEAAKAFYAELLGWEYGEPGEQGGLHVSNRQPDGGLGGGREGTAPDLFFRVADLEAAVAKVRDLGGTAEVVAEGPEGRHARCTDDQGVPFGLSQPAEGY